MRLQMWWPVDSQERWDKPNKTLSDSGVSTITNKQKKNKKKIDRWANRWKIETKKVSQHPREYNGNWKSYDGTAVLEQIFSELYRGYSPRYCNLFSELGSLFDGRYSKSAGDVPSQLSITPFIGPLPPFILHSWFLSNAHKRHSILPSSHTKHISSIFLR